MAKHMWRPTTQGRTPNLDAGPLPPGVTRRDCREESTHSVFLQTVVCVHGEVLKPLKRLSRTALYRKPKSTLHAFKQENQMYLWRSLQWRRAKTLRRDRRDARLQNLQPQIVGAATLALTINALSCSPSGVQPAGPNRRPGGQGGPARPGPGGHQSTKARGMARTRRA